MSGIAGRYASALFDLAREQGTLDAAASDLASIDEMIGGSVDLARLVRSPVISRKDQGRAMAAVLESANISELVCRFVGLVAQNRRLFGLRDMIAAFRALLAVHRGETTARVTSAQPLTDEQVERIKSQLAGLVDQKYRSPQTLMKVCSAGSSFELVRAWLIVRCGPSFRKCRPP